MKPVILTGLRSNNVLHIGNYLGAMLPLIDMARQRSEEFDIHLFVPDLHSFTTPIDHSLLYQQTIDNLKIYAAAGLPLTNTGIRIYRQSFVPAHSEMAWILDCFTGMGEMNRMTQFKDKSAKLTEDRISVGLFNYPVLMAADILLYGAAYVPVGDDQTQHLEFTRDIAERFNNQFGEIFTVPQAVKKQHEFFGKDQGLRIRDLVNPAKKMSKSDETGKGVIFLNDSPEVARKKVMSATTDSFSDIQYDFAERPGVSNLIDMLVLFSSTSREEILAEFAGQSQYGPLKTRVADSITEFLDTFQQKLAAVNETEILEKLSQDEIVANQMANETLFRAQKAVGLRA